MFGRVKRCQHRVINHVAVQADDAAQCFGPYSQQGGGQGCTLANADGLDAGVGGGAEFVVVNGIKDPVGCREDFWEVGVLMVLAGEPVVAEGRVESSL